MNRKEFYNSLSEDVKGKLKACKSEDEMMKVLSSEGIELDDELLDSVSGGLVHKPDPHSCWSFECYSCPSDDGC